MLRTALLLALLLVPTSLFAAHYSDLYVIPVASHVNGVNGTMWVSDLAIQNFGPQVLEVQIFVIESALGPADNVYPIEGDKGFVTIQPGGSALIRDILANHRGMSMTTGALLVGANAPFTLTSRSYSMSPSGDTVGQTVVPVRDFIENTLGTTNNAMATAYIPGIIQNARFRTNVGFVAGTASTSTESATVEFILRGQTGAVLGTRTFTVEAGNFMHTQFPLTSMTNLQGNIDIAGLDVRISRGNAAVIPYASVIDNVTADAVYVSGNFPANAPFAKVAYNSPFRELFQRLKK